MVSVFKIGQNSSAPAGTMHWLNECVERGKKCVFSERVNITPALATMVLGRNPDNRNISPTKAGHYARDMINGMWAENGETIVISNDGLLNDGQHRLQAVIDSNTVQPFLVVFGVSRASRTTVDQGRARGAGDYLAMDGVRYAVNAATAAKFIIAYERANGRNISQRPFITNCEIVARVKADDEIIRSATYASHHYKAHRSLFSNTVMMACHYILSEVNAKDAEEYLNQVALGENIERGDPAFAVRQAFLSEKRERQEAMEIIFHGWNKFRQRSTLRAVRTNGTLPALV